jgi:hypothetical protein
MATIQILVDLLITSMTHQPFQSPIDQFSMRLIPFRQSSAIQVRSYKQKQPPTVTPQS